MAATTISSFSGKSALLSYFRFVVPRTSARLKDYAGEEAEIAKQESEIDIADNFCLGDVIVWSKV